MADIRSFASQSPSNYAWTVEQMLEQALADIRAGTLNPTKAMITFFEEDPKTKSTSIDSWRARIDRDEEIALLALLQHNAIERWKG